MINSLEPFDHIIIIKLSRVEHLNISYLLASMNRAAIDNHENKPLVSDVDFLAYDLTWNFWIMYQLYFEISEKSLY